MELATRDRLNQWGIAYSILDCPMCSNEVDNIDHLFFECAYTWRIWSSILKLLGIHKSVMSTNEENQWVIIHAKDISTATAAYWMSLAACTYHTCIERNLRIFQQKQRTWNNIIKVSSRSCMQEDTRRLNLVNNQNSWICESFFLDDLII